MTMDNKLQKRLIYDLTLEEVEQLTITLGQPAYRAKQIWQGIYHHLWQKPEEFTTLPDRFKTALFENLEFSSLQPIQMLQSSDGETIKTLFSLADKRSIEAVIMHYDQRRTLCISTQVGCASDLLRTISPRTGGKGHQCGVYGNGRAFS
jgi:23S rRNA (adenine2503-C2)-methyltransferase